MGTRTPLVKYHVMKLMLTQFFCCLIFFFFLVFFSILFWSNDILPERSIWVASFATQWCSARITWHQLPWRPGRGGPWWGTHFHPISSSFVYLRPLSSTFIHFHRGQWGEDDGKASFNLVKCTTRWSLSDRVCHCCLDSCDDHIYKTVNMVDFCDDCIYSPSQMTEKYSTSMCYIL